MDPQNLQTGDGVRVRAGRPGAGRAGVVTRVHDRAWVLLDGEDEETLYRTSSLEVVPEASPQASRPFDPADPPPCGTMTVEQLRRIVENLANASFTRYWIKWRATRERSFMAISCVTADASPEDLDEPEMARRGFAKWTDADGLVFWVTERVDGAGNPHRTPPEMPLY